jgi:transposase
LKFENSAQGFAAFDAWLAKIQQKHGMTEAVVRFEPTGHYWFNLGDHLAECGHKLAILSPYHVKCARELDDNSPSKSDQKDPKTIAMLVKDGRTGMFTFQDMYVNTKYRVTLCIIEPMQNWPSGQEEDWGNLCVQER